MAGPMSLAQQLQAPAFIPPFPPRPTQRLGVPEVLRRLFRNQLELWHDAHYEEPAFRIRLLNRDILVCNGPETVRAAFIEQHAALARRSAIFTAATRPLLGESVFVTHGALWQQRRAVVAAASHASRLDAIGPAITAAVALRRAAWRAQPGTTVDMLAEMGTLAMEVVCRVLFGDALGQRAAAGFTTPRTAGILRRLLVADIPAIFRAPDWLPRPWLWPRLPDMAVLHRLTDAMVQQALRLPAGEGGMVQQMATAPGMAGKALRDEALGVLMAGHETTATGLAWAWFLLAAAPGAMARLRAEAAPVLQGRTATVADLSALPYARAVVEETLRLYPPVPMITRDAAEDCTVAGHAVRRGTLVMVIPWLLHRHRQWWEMPDAFLPERFLPGAPPRPRHAYIPFSLGPRACTGAQMALAESVIALASLVQDVAPRLVDAAAVMPLCRMTLRPGETLPMVLDPA